MIAHYLYPLFLRWRWDSSLYVLPALSENNDDLISWICEVSFFCVPGPFITLQNSRLGSQLHGNTDQWLKLWHLKQMLFFPFYSYPNLQWITSCLHHAHISLLATQSAKLEDPEPTVVLFRSLCHVWLFCNPMAYSLPGFLVHGISQARILEWVAVSFSRRSSWPRDQTHVSCICRRILYHWDPGSPGLRKAEHYLSVAAGSHDVCKRINCCCFSLPWWGPESPVLMALLLWLFPIRGQSL